MSPYGACLLGSFNLAKYVYPFDGGFSFDLHTLKKDIPHVVRAMDNIHDISVFPLEQHKQESVNKRRMGLGVTGVANAGEALGFEYGSPPFLTWFEGVMEHIRNDVYAASVELAKEKGAFPLFDERYCDSMFIKTLPNELQQEIREHGIRNSHLLSVAPAGTISLTADNVSSGIEPVFSHYYDRTIQTYEGVRTERVEDYGYRVFYVEGKTAHECTPDDHMNVLAIATKYVDSAVSKTVNVSPDMQWDDFKEIYMQAWKLGCKGCTTFNSGGKRFGILNTVEPKEEEVKACYIDPNTGQKECS